LGDDVRVVRGVLGVGLGLTGSSEPIDFVRDRGVRDLDAIPLVVGSGDFPLARAFASAGDIDRGMPPRPVRVDSPTIGEPERPLRIAMGPAERLVAPQQASLSRQFRATTESNLATAKFDVLLLTRCYELTRCYDGHSLRAQEHPAKPRRR